VDIYETYRLLTPTSESLHQKALGLFPGGVSHNIRGFSPHPVYPTRASGARITDADGRTYIDLWMGHYSLILGHAFPDVAQELTSALQLGWHWGMPSEAQVELAKRLRQTVPSMEEMRFCTTGTEATMYAVRLARGFTRKPWVLKVAGGWHGASTDLSFAVRAPFAGAEGPGLRSPEEQGVDLLWFNDIEASLRVVESHRGQIAGIIVEPVLGSGGFLPARPDYLRFLRQICDREGAVLIFDEIITGFRFRYGTLAEEYGVRPDLTALGKIVGGGLPIGVYGGRREILETANPLAAKGPDRPVLVGGGTFSCNPLAMTAALATLRALETRGESWYSGLGQRGEALRKGIEERFAAAGVPAVCTGKGSLFMTHLLRGEDREIDSPAGLAAKTRPAIRDRELRIALLNRGVFAVQGGGALSEAHREPEIAEILGAYEDAARTVKGIVAGSG